MTSRCLLFFESVSASRRHLLAFWQDLANSLTNSHFENFTLFIAWLDALADLLPVLAIQIHRAGTHNYNSACGIVIMFVIISLLTANSTGKGEGMDFFNVAQLDAAVALLFCLDLNHGSEELHEINTSLRANIQRSATTAACYQLPAEQTIKQIFRCFSLILQVGRSE
jgi:hypothetical protein